MTEHVIVTDADGIRTIRMNRPDKKNALTLAMYEAMTAALEGANADDSVRCVLIAGVPGAFSAGNDLADFRKAAESSGGLNRPALRFLPALVRCNKPLVAAVSGVAVGVGTTMLFHCDFVVAGSDAYFSTPFVSLGLIPEAASSLLAPRLMGQRRAFEFLVMGHPLNAMQAKEFGIANIVVAPEEVDTEGLKAAIAFGAVSGLLWLSTVPPTSGLVAVMFGTRWLAMLYGFAFFSHQVGGFLSVARRHSVRTHGLLRYRMVALGVPGDGLSRDQSADRRAARAKVGDFAATSAHGVVKPLATSRGIGWGLSNRGAFARVICCVCS